MIAKTQEKIGSAQEGSYLSKYLESKRQNSPGNIPPVQEVMRFTFPAAATVVCWQQTRRGGWLTWGAMAATAKENQEKVMRVASQAPLIFFFYLCPYLNSAHRSFSSTTMLSLQHLHHPHYSGAGLKRKHALSLRGVLSFTLRHFEQRQRGENSIGWM